jgi:hypothetical protein
MPDEWSSVSKGMLIADEIQMSEGLMRIRAFCMAC